MTKPLTPEDAAKLVVGTKLIRIEDPENILPVGTVVEFRNYSPATPRWIAIQSTYGLRELHVEKFGLYEVPITTRDDIEALYG